MEKGSPFLSFVQLTLKKWSGFQIAIEEGMGEPYAREKESFMCELIEKYFVTYSDVTPADLEEYIWEIVAQEFRIQCDTDDILEVSKKLCEAYELYLVNPDALVFKEARKEYESIYNPYVKKSVQSEQVMTEESISVQMKQSVVEGTEDEEWTVVTRRRRK